LTFLQFVKTSLPKINYFKNTEEIVGLGGFGVPDFYLPHAKKFFFGADRLHFVEYYLGNKDAKQFRKVPKILPTRKSKPVLTFYYDFSSPWSYIASTQVERIAKEGDAVIEYVPILLGALFREIGTPNVPMLATIEAKRNYNSADLQEWCKWWNIKLHWPSAFPIRTVNPLRVAIIEPRVIHILYKAAWVDDKNIGDDKVLEQVLNDNGFDGKGLLKKAGEAKDQLIKNTTRANTVGCCGVPSFQVNHGEVLWGQDRMDVVLDLLCGWDSSTPPRSKM